MRLLDKSAAKSEVCTAFLCLLFVLIPYRSRCIWSKNSSSLHSWRYSSRY